MTVPIPADFPFAPTGSALGGTQLKFSVSRDSDGVLREASVSRGDRERDFIRCMEVIDWGVGFLKQKALKPKYAGLSRGELLLKFQINLEQDFDMPPAYTEWILKRVALRLGLD